MTRPTYEKQIRLLQAQLARARAINLSLVHRAMLVRELDRLYAEKPPQAPEHH